MHSTAPHTVRDAGEADIAGIAAVAIACGQALTDSGADPAYVHHLLANGEVAVAIDRHGEVVGFGATRRVGSTSVLTDLFVSPAQQAGGVGRSLLDRLWGEAGEARMTFSSQHPSAMPLYGRFGLAARWPLLYLTGSPDQLGDSPLRTHAASADEAAAVELGLIDVDRRADYAYWLRDDPEGGVVVVSNGRPVAAGAATSDGIVHLACHSPAMAAEVLIAALISRMGHSIIVSVPGPHPALPLLLRRGFTVTDFDLYMSTEDSLAPTTGVYSPGLA